MTAKLRFALAAIATVASMALTGATASVVMSALQSAVPSDSAPATTTPVTDDVPGIETVEQPSVTQLPARVLATETVDNVSVADVTAYSSPSRAHITSSDVVDLLPATVHRYCDLATPTDAAETCDLLAEAITIAVPAAGRTFAVDR